MLMIIMIMTIMKLKRSPRPKLEPQTTSLDKCNINSTILETEYTKRLLSTI